jgi:hypothetical protein
MGEALEETGRGGGYGGHYSTIGLRLAVNF